MTVATFPARPVAGGLVTVRITATNNGPGDAVGVTIRSKAPADATEASGTTTKGSCTGTLELVCSLGTLSASPPSASASQRRVFAAGESVQVEHRFRLSAASPVTIQAVVEAGSADPNPTDNHWETSLTVLQEPPVDDGKPNANETVVVEELSGRVLIQLPGTSRYVDLATLTLREIPNGTLVDAREGRFELTVAAAGDTTSSTVFWAGIAAVSQHSSSMLATPAQAASPGVTELRLTGGDFGAPCKAALARPKAKKKGTRRTFAVGRAKPVKPVRRLWGSGSGNFRTRGRFSSASVRGTVWLTEDYCNGTLVRVDEGSVTARDLVRNRTVIVAAGTSYFAEAPPARSAKSAKAKRSKKRTTARTQR